jgi:hypothetical protein
MVDTTRIWFDLEKPLGDDATKEIDERLRKGRKCIGNDGNVQVFPYAHAYGQHPARISAQTSLPKLINGSNVNPLSLDDTRKALRIFTKDVSKILQLDSSPSLEECHVFRADFVYDWIVESPEAYLSVLERFAVVRGNHDFVAWRKGITKGSSVIVGSKQQMMRIYNKEAEVARHSQFGAFQESECELAKGRLRAELSVTSKGWKSVLGKNSPTLVELDNYLQSNGRSCLVRKWEKFTDGWGDSSVESATVNLVAAYGKKRGRQLSEMLSLVRSMGVTKYQQICSPDRSTWYRFRRSLQEAGVPLTESGSLERLTLPQFDDFESSNRVAKNENLKRQKLPILSHHKLNICPFPSRTLMSRRKMR